MEYDLGQVKGFNYQKLAYYFKKYLEPKKLVSVLATFSSITKPSKKVNIALK